MKLTTITKTSGVAWVHAVADQEILDANRAELAWLKDPARSYDLSQRWPDPLNPWARVATIQLEASICRMEAIIAAQEAALVLKQLEEAIKEARASNAAL